MHTQEFLPLTVVIPTLNEARRIRETIGTVLANVGGHTRFNIIVADSGSEDHTYAEVMSARLDGAKVGVEVNWTQAPEKGVALARNTGAKEAKGEFIFFLDADTHIDNKFLASNLLQMHRRALDVGAAYIKPDSDRWIDNAVVGFSNFVLGVMQYTSRPMGFGAGMFVRKSSFEVLSGFDTTINFGEDVNLVHRSVKSGFRFGMLPGVVTTSTRRAQREGRFTLATKIARGLVHQLISGNAQKANVDYEFGKGD